ncbi:Uncharacterized protein FWK35_00036430 [Aphis craccivora]|uniref:Uncharacterized protein n=1 Tax=Aphis craccivora TaxID=307492 RepID=A0A6G0W3M0_APHCR|nr:Uncharacterized protein FWK35_00028779 [Aphis craccivora]KAF0717952.1 Uncharacterized protein FWK35_00036430 [Aphis craccivora]
MATLRERLNLTMNVCRLFGLGLEPDDAASAVVDALIFLGNLLYSAYGYDHVTSVVQQRMPLIWDITTVMSVAKVYTYLLAPPVMLIAWQCNKRSLTDAVSALDRAAVADTPPSLVPFVRYSAAWLCMSVLIEFAAYTMFHVDTDFVYFTVTEYGMIAVYNVWTTVPLLMYAFLLDAIRTSVRDINDRLITVADWRTYRGRWDDLRRTAVHQTRDLFGVTIVAFIMCTIAEIVFFGFSLYLFGIKVYHVDAFRIIVYSINAAFSVSWIFEIIRMTKNCKLEVGTRSGGDLVALRPR